jgi:hypothetical protein
MLNISRCLNYLNIVFGFTRSSRVIPFDFDHYQRMLENICTKLIDIHKHYKYNIEQSYVNSKKIKECLNENSLKNMTMTLKHKLLEEVKEINLSELMKLLNEINEMPKNKTIEQENQYKNTKHRIKELISQKYNET